MISIDEAIAQTKDKISFLNELISPQTKPQIFEQIQIQIIAYQDCLKILEEVKQEPCKGLDD